MGISKKSVFDFAVFQYTDMDVWEKFAESTGRYFRFLETEFGFARKKPKQPFASYESDKLQVLVFYDSDRRHELDLRIRRLADDIRKIPSVGLSEMVLLTDKPLAEKRLAPCPSTDETVEVEVARLAEELKRYGTPFLKGDERAFERIERLRRDREKEIAAQARHINRL